MATPKQGKTSPTHQTAGVYAEPSAPVECLHASVCPEHGARARECGYDCGQPCRCCNWMPGNAARLGHHECLLRMRDTGAKWDARLPAQAAAKGHLECLRQLHEHGCPWDETTCSSAAMNGHLKCLVYAHKNGCPWNGDTCGAAAACEQPRCLEYALDNGCPYNKSALSRLVKSNNADVVRRLAALGIHDCGPHREKCVHYQYQQESKPPERSFTLVRSRQSESGAPYVYSKSIVW